MSDKESSARRIIKLFMEGNLVTAYCEHKPRRHSVVLGIAENAEEQIETLVNEILREHGITLPEIEQPLSPP
jgi:hypothetical protein